MSILGSLFDNLMILNVIKANVIRKLMKKHTSDGDIDAILVIFILQF